MRPGTETSHARRPSCTSTPSVYHHQMSETVKAFMAAQNRRMRWAARPWSRLALVRARTEERGGIGLQGTPQEAMEGWCASSRSPGRCDPTALFVAAPHLLTIDVLSDANGPADVAHGAAESPQRDRETLIFSFTGSEARNEGMRERGLRLLESRAAAHAPQVGASKFGGPQRGGDPPSTLLQFQDTCGCRPVALEAVAGEGAPGARLQEISEPNVAGVQSLCGRGGLAFVIATRSSVQDNPAKDRDDRSRRARRPAPAAGAQAALAARPITSWLLLFRVRVACRRHRWTHQGDLSVRRPHQARLATPRGDG